jgi:long-chain acyl-CoA synthetase
VARSSKEPDVQVTLGLRRAARANGEQLAVVDGTVRLSWRETEQRVARAAAALCQLGMRPGDRVAILALNGFRYLELYYAVPWAAGVVMPLNTRLTATEVAAQLADAEASILVVDEAMAAMLPALAGQASTVRAVVFVGTGAPPPGALAYEQLLTEVEPMSDADVGGGDTYGLFYTGGTTGASKGVMLSHDNICANAYNHAVCFEYRAKDRYLHAAPMFHLADSSATFAVTTLGATHAFLPVFSPDAWARTVAAHAVTRTLLVPTMISAIVNMPDLGAHDLGSLAQIVYGGSPIAPSVLAAAQAALRCDFAQGYGMTETSPLLTTLPPADHAVDGPCRHRLRSAGLPVPQVEVAVLDGDGHRVPCGQIGEICARGAMVMKGYWRRPDDTAHALRGGFMHTGDVGYVDEDGYVYLVDRAKDMIVTGGENVYSVEVEAALASHAGVVEAAVFGVPHERLGEQVHAVVVVRGDAEVTVDGCLAHCRSRIARYKCPRTITIQTTPLPKSGAGKILKRELRKRFWEGLERQIH